MTAQLNAEFLKLKQAVDNYVQALIEQIKCPYDKDMLAYGHLMREIKRFYAKAIPIHPENDIRQFISDKLNLVQRVVVDVNDVNRVCAYAVKALLNEVIKGWYAAKTTNDCIKVLSNMISAASQDVYLNSSKAYIEHVNKLLETGKPENLLAEINTLKQQLSGSSEREKALQEKLDAAKEKLDSIKKKLAEAVN